MSDFQKPKAVWISPAVIGQKPRERKVFIDEEPPIMKESPPLNPEALCFKVAEQSPGGGIWDAETEGVLTTTTMEPMADRLGGPHSLVDPTMIPLPESDSDDLVELPDAHSAIRKAIELEIPELADHSTGPSSQWASPTWSDEGITARVWVAPIIAEHDRWMFVKANLKTMELIPRSPFVPRNFSEWLIHRAEMTDIKVKELTKQVANKEAMAALGPDRPQFIAPFIGKTFEEADNGISRSGVGAEETFWSLWMKPTKNRPRADWPCQAEMKEEGDERNTSGFGRFPALPRVNGNETVNYKHKSIIAATRLDTVWPPPTSQEETAELDDDYARLLVGKELAGALDAD